MNIQLNIPSFKVFNAINVSIMLATLWIIPFNANPQTSVISDLDFKYICHHYVYSYVDTLRCTYELCETFDFMRILI